MDGEQPHLPIVKHACSIGALVRAQRAFWQTLRLAPEFDCDTMGQLLEQVVISRSNNGPECIVQSVGARTAYPD